MDTELPFLADSQHQFGIRRTIGKKDEKKEEITSDADRQRKIGNIDPLKQPNL